MFSFALRNIDHNPSSPSTEDSWDGTANSLTKHLESKTHGIKRCSAQSAHAALIVLQHLPKKYTTVYPFVFRSTDVYVPRLHKRKDMVPFDILMIQYHEQLKRQTKAYFFTRKNVAQSYSKITVKTINCDYCSGYCDISISLYT